MKKKIICIILFFLINVSLFGCNSIQSIQPPKKADNVLQPVAIENVDNKYYKIVIDYNSGVSHKEMGILLGKEIKSKIPNFERDVDRFLSQMINVSGNSSWFCYNTAKQIMKNVDKAYVDELDGLASQLTGGNDDLKDDGKLSKDELYLYNLAADILRPNSCSAVSVYGGRTSDGKTITGRELEWIPGIGEPAKNIPSVTVYKQGNKSFCSIGYVGFMGVITGFSTNKVFSAILDVDSVNPSKIDDIRSYPFDIRYAL